MKNKVLIIIGIVLIIAFTIVIIRNQQEKSKNTVSSEPIPTVSEIELNTKQNINQLEKVKIKGTNDTIMITKKVNFEVPDYGEGTTVSFALAIPYTITVDGVDYSGTYVLNSNNNKSEKSDSNPKYILEVKNLTKNGDIEVLIKNI